ncbi:MAG: hypothetical protein ACTSYR_00065 [Candidatus Odinarchaeia archaeon]
MVSKKLVLATVAIIISAGAGAITWFMFFSYPYSLPLGESPNIGLPTYQFSNLTGIQGFGQVTPDYYHNGFDFAVNASTVFISPHNGTVT